MVIAYKITLLFVILISLVYAVGSEEHEKETSKHATAICIAAIISFIVTSIYL